MIQLAWRFLIFQKDSASAQWFEPAPKCRGTRKTMIVALARKLQIASAAARAEGVVPDGVDLRLHNHPEDEDFNESFAQPVRL